MTIVSLDPLDKAGKSQAQRLVARDHYLHAQVDPRCSVEGYQIVSPSLQGGESDVLSAGVGIFLLGRPEATRVNGWYGSVEDVASGRCQVTRWQVLNLARVWIDPRYQPGGQFHHPSTCPGFIDRKGRFRSTMASTAIFALSARVGFDYLVRRPPVFLDEPYEIRWLLSYCDTRLHKGIIYRSAGFELYRTNQHGIQTWRLPLPPLTSEQDSAVRNASRLSRRSQAYRARRAQLEMEL